MNFNFLWSRRKLVLFCIDFCIMAVAGLLAFFVADILFGIYLPMSEYYGSVVVLVLCQLAGMVCTRVYDNIWRYAVVTDFFGCVVGIAGGAVLYYALCNVFSVQNSEVIAILTVLISALGIIFARVCYSMLYRFMRARQTASGKKRALIVGAGEAGKRIILEMKAGDSPYTAVGAADDGAGKVGRNICGVKVMGEICDIPRIAEETGAELIILAMPSVDMQTKKRILGICSETMCEVKKLPYIHELVEGTLLGQTRKINIEDLLGRDVVRFDSDRSKNLIAGKTCMVTGGGGSIGSELCRQIAALSPAKLVIVDIYENNAYDIQQELLIKYGRGLPLEVHIASVRDLDKMDRIFADVRPELVFHAAAHKHVPLMENDPEEAIKNNVQGTYHCAMLADKYGADKFVLVSTDKAVNPTNVMGASKRCCEMIVQYFAQKHPGTEFVAVRFGNVLGSNGSVIPLFERQIESGGPITVTHPDIIRYFMTIPEAVSLILQAGAMARGGEIFVLDMGEPVKILSLAENLIRLHGKEPYVDINIEFSGLRPGEKLFEELLMDEEGLRKTENEKIFIGRQIDIDSETFREELEDIIECAKHNDGDAVVAKLRKIVPTFSHVVINK